MITTDFARLPDLFLRVYERHLLAWAENFAKYGASIEVDLLRAPGSEIDLRAMSRKVRLGARFEHGEVGTAFLVVPVADGYPALFGWGDVEDGNNPIIQFELAKTWLLNNLTARP